jgi:hypothetical protein
LNIKPNKRLLINLIILLFFCSRIQGESSKVLLLKVSPIGTFAERRIARHDRGSRQRKRDFRFRKSFFELDQDGDEPLGLDKEVHVLHRKQNIGQRL